MLRYELQRGEEGLTFCLFDTPDRVQHMFWHGHRDGEACQGAGGAMAGAIEEHFRACDAIIGEALGQADEETLLIVLSDHGMAGFERGVHLNTWLHANGFLTLKEGMRPSAEAGDLLQAVDWSRTRAYALGLGAIYLNLKGREERGIVEASDVGGLKDAIATGLAGLADRDRGKMPVRAVRSKEELYSGKYASAAPDMLVNFAEGYRVSWDTPMGGIPEGLFQDNDKRWCADHAIDPTLVPGVLFMNQPFRTASANIVGLAPTILDALGVPKGPAMEGDSLLS
jgi:predicted AlkP superfamily phosphohydrolase/phosphomutase